VAASPFSAAAAQGCAAFAESRWPRSGCPECSCWAAGRRAGAARWTPAPGATDLSLLVLLKH